ncbi:MAG: carbohydrate-binding domain-containing protein, partial [Ruminococcus sp.]
MKKILSVILSLCLVLALFTACSVEKTGNETPSGDEDTSSAAESEEDGVDSTDGDMFTKRDSETDFDEASAVKIELNGTSASSSDSSVKISGTTVTITKEATHIISGTLSDGMIIVDAPDTAKLQLVLNGADITSSNSAPLYIKEADKVFVTLVGENTLTSGDIFTAIDENNIDAAVFSKQDLTFNGDGYLTVSSPAGHGITGKDDLVFTGGTYSVTSASHGIQANDSVRIKNATIVADSGKDGIHAENTEDTDKGFVYISSGTVKIECEGDGISSSSYMQIKDGTVDILAGGGYENGTKESSDGFGKFGGGPGGFGGRPISPQGMSVTTDTAADDESSSSMKGMKSNGSMMISGGSFTIDSADDALHSNTTVDINGGSFDISSGDDAVHAEESLTVTDGKINIAHCYEGLEAQHLIVSGGNIRLVATDDGLNAAGGTDNSGMGG